MTDWPLTHWLTQLNIILDYSILFYTILNYCLSAATAAAAAAIATDLAVVAATVDVATAATAVVAAAATEDVCVWIFECTLGVDVGMNSGVEFRMDLGLMLGGFLNHVSCSENYKAKRLQTIPTLALFSLKINPN